jgi:acetyl esterase/lipase
MLHSLLLLTLATAPAADVRNVPLWDGPAPATVGEPGANRPSIDVYLPPADKANGTGVVVCPGGGYAFLALDHEGKQVADWLNARGVAAFVLHYRIVTKGRPAPLHPAPLMDVQRALRTVRAKAAEYHVQPDRVGVWGFSAGGHLASSAATHFDPGKSDSDDPIERASCRPDFAILAYPVVSMDPSVSHGGSRTNLLGKDPTPELVELMSNDRQVSKSTPPTFIFHTDDDKAVPVANSLLFYLACKKNGVSVEMHSYAHGTHGVGLALKDPILGTWPDRLEAWMAARGLIKKNEVK